jgi:hypothetical protein
MTITLSTEARYALNVWTYQYGHRALREAVERADPPYLLPPDLFVRRADRATLEAVVADLIGQHGLKDEWRCPSEEPEG